MVPVEPAFGSRTGWRRFYPDLPGHGKSPGAKRIRDMDDYLDVVLEFIDEVAGEKDSRLEGSPSEPISPWPSLGDVSPKS